MSYTVYGLRLKGKEEVRYIGETNTDPNFRLLFHCRHAKQPDLRNWLDANAGNVEAITLDVASSRSEARDLERLAISHHLDRGHRLLNRRSLPASHYPLAAWGSAA